MSNVASVSAATVDQQRRTDSRTWAAVYVAVVCLSAVLGLLALQTAPAPFALPVTMLVLGCLLVAVKPVAGLYLLVFFTLCTDTSISPWFPFAKNLSSQESILYMGDSINISPLKIVVGVMAVSLVLRLLLDRSSPRFVRGALFRPMMAFTAFIIGGFVFGQITGGDRYVAVWEARPIFYLPVVYILFTNLFTTRRQYQRIAVTAFVALLVHSLLALRVLHQLPAADRATLESLVDHGSAVQFDVVLLVAFAAWLIPRAPRPVRWLVPLAAIPIGWVWLVSQRRAAAIGLAVGFLVLGLLMVRLNPKRLRAVGPVFAVVAVGYLGAFWHSESAVGFPAQSIKSVIAPGSVSEKDQSSDIYRILENVDISATIHYRPITGVGFGQKFLRPAPLPDISNFPFYEYIPHNSILWVWLKVGVGGFIAMLYLLGSAVRSGTKASMRLHRPAEVMLAVGATIYVIMYAVFAYVDIAWDGRSMVALALGHGHLFRAGPASR